MAHDFQYRGVLGRGEDVLSQSGDRICGRCEGFKGALARAGFAWTVWIYDLPRQLDVEAWMVERRGKSDIENGGVHD